MQKVKSLYKALSWLFNSIKIDPLIILLKGNKNCFYLLRAADFRSLFADSLSRNLIHRRFQRIKIKNLTFKSSIFNTKIKFPFKFLYKIP